MTDNRRVVLTSRPCGRPAASDFRIEDVPVPVVGAGQVLLRTLYVSLDPYLRGRMGPGLVHGSTSPFMTLGETVASSTVSQVVESCDPTLTVGDVVLAATGWQELGVQDASTVRRLDPRSAPPSTALGVLGMPGFTAYAGLTRLGAARPGETVVVAAAAGPVGSTVAQVARLQGARVVCVAGGSAKTSWLRSLGFDAVVDHRLVSFVDDLADATPQGVDVYFENVGGRVLDAVVPRLNPHARVPVCGLASEYNGPATVPAASQAPATPDRLSALMSAVLTRSVMLRGFAVTEFDDDVREEFDERVGGWVASGDLRYREDVVDGLENAAGHFVDLLHGRTFGKTLVRVDA